MLKYLHINRYYNYKLQAFKLENVYYWWHLSCAHLQNTAKTMTFLINDKTMWISIHCLNTSTDTEDTGIFITVSSDLTVNLPPYYFLCTPSACISRFLQQVTKVRSYEKVFVACKKSSKSTCVIRQCGRSSRIITEWQIHFNAAISPTPSATFAM